MGNSTRFMTLFSLLAFLPGAAFAGTVGCGCYCGKVLTPPCSDQACKTAGGYSVSYDCARPGCVLPGWVDSLSVSGQEISFRSGEKWALPKYGEDGGTVNVHSSVKLTLSAKARRLSGNTDAEHVGNGAELASGYEDWLRRR